MKKSELRKIIREELLKEKDHEIIDGKTREQIIDLLIKNGFNAQKIKRSSDDGLATIYRIAKKKGMVKEQTINENFFDFLKGTIEKDRQRRAEKEVGGELSKKIKNYHDAYNDLEKYVNGELSQEEIENLVKKLKK